VAPVVKPVVETVAPVIKPVVDMVAPMVQPVIDVIAPVAPLVTAEAAPVVPSTPLWRRCRARALGAALLVAPAPRGRRRASRRPVPPVRAGRCRAQP
jgi:hypothetical protein